MPLSIRPTTDDLWVLWQVFGTKEYELAETFEWNSVLDLGGNCGYTSLFLHSINPKAKIVTLEPDLSNHAVLKENVRGIATIVPVLGGVASKDGLLKFSSGKGSSSANFRFSETQKAEDSDPDLVPAYSIDSLSKKHDVDVWDFIKMDIEGGEEEMLRSIDSWFGRCRVLAVEIHSECREFCNSVIKQLEDKGLQVKRLGETTWVFKNSSPTP